MKTNLTQLAVMTSLLCCVSLQALCDPVQPDTPPQTANPILAGKPAISPSSTSGDLDKYVQYLQQQGYQILYRQQQLNGAGTVFSFHLRAARPKGTPTASSPKSFVLVNGDYRKMTEKVIVFNKKVTLRRTKNHPNEQASATAASDDRPILSTHPTRNDLDKYVSYYHRQGYTVTERQQKFKKDGKLVLFRFHAIRNSKTLFSPSRFIETVVTPQGANETDYVGPSIDLTR